MEVRLLATLSAKHELALAALDADSDVTQVDLQSGMEELKRRLEVLLGAKPEAPVDETARQQAETAAEAEQDRQHQQRAAAAGGELQGAMFHFLDERVGAQPAAAPSPEIVNGLRDRLSSCVQEDENGQQRLSLALPNREALDRMANTLARFLVAGQSNP